MTKLLVNPKIDGYSLQFGNNVIATKLDGGASRMRLDKIGAVHEAQVQWALTAQAYNYLMAFYRTEIDQGSLPFTIDLKAADETDLGTYTARIVPGTMSARMLGDDFYMVNATLELTPATASEEDDQDLIDAGPGE